MATKIVKKGRIGLEDLETGAGTFSRDTSSGGSQTLTRISLNQLISTITPVSSTPTTVSATSGELLLVDPSSADITCDLPTAVGNDGVTKIFKHVGTANRVIIDPNGSQTIDGSATYELDIPQDKVTIISDGSNWHTIA